MSRQKMSIAFVSDLPGFNLAWQEKEKPFFFAQTSRPRLNYIEELGESFVRIFKERDEKFDEIISQVFHLVNR